MARRPAAASGDDSDSDLSYEDGLRHAHDYLTGRSEDNPFAGRPGVSDLQNAQRLSGAPAAPAGSSPNAALPNPQVPGGRGSPGTRGAPRASTASRLYTPPAAGVAASDQSRLIDEDIRKSQGISAADWAARPGGPKDLFSSGFFKPAAEREQELAEADRARREAGRNVVRATLSNQGRDAEGNYLEGGGVTRLPNVTPAGPTPPVGGTQAVSVNAPNAVKAGTGGRITAGVDAQGRPTNTLNSPYGGGTTTFDNTPGTRTPFISDRPGGTNLARDFIAGGRFSSAQPGTDKSLNPTFVAALPRTRTQTAANTTVPRIFGGAGS